MAGKYYVLGGHIYGNTVGYNGVYNGEPGKWYGQSVHVQGLSFNGEALLTIGGNALTVDAGTVLTDADYPAVPEKDGCTGEWNKVTDPITEDTTIEAVYTPKAPGSSSTHVTKELFTIQCTAKHEHNWFCNWFGSHVVYNKDMAYDEARGVWTCSAYVKLGNFLNLTTIRNGYFGGMTHHYDVARRLSISIGIRMQPA